MKESLHNRLSFQHILTPWLSLPFVRVMQAHESVKGHLLSDLEGVSTESGDTESPMVVIDTAGCDLEVCHSVVFV